MNPSMLESMTSFRSHSLRQFLSCLADVLLTILGTLVYLYNGLSIFIIQVINRSLCVRNYIVTLACVPCNNALRAFRSNCFVPGRFLV